MVFPLSIGSLGVVYGDIGTSPLYAFRESIAGIPISVPVVLGVLSLTGFYLFPYILIRLHICLKFLTLFPHRKQKHGGIFGKKNCLLFW